MKEREQFVTFNKLKEKELSQQGAAKQLGCSVRWVRKKYKRFLKHGAEGLVHQNRGRSSPKKLAKETVKLVCTLFERKFNGFGPTFAAEKLDELYGIKMSKETMRKLMIKHQYWHARILKPKYRQKRDRKEYFGEMVQLDGSPHDWFEGRNKKYTLLVFIDDATSIIPFMKFVDGESTEEVMQELR